MAISGADLLKAVKMAIPITILLLLIIAMSEATSQLATIRLGERLRLTIITSP